MQYQGECRGLHKAWFTCVFCDDLICIYIYHAPETQGMGQSSGGPRDTLGAGNVAVADFALQTGLKIENAEEEEVYHAFISVTGESRKGA